MMINSWPNIKAEILGTNIEREKARFNEAEKIVAVNYDGPVFCCDLRHHDGYFADLGEFYDWWEDQAGEGDTAPLLPGYVWACHSKPCCHINLDFVLEHSSQDAHEDFELSDLSGLEKLQSAVDAFNALNDDKHRSWETNYKLAVLLGDFKETQ